MRYGTTYPECLSHYYEAKSDVAPHAITIAAILACMEGQEGESEDKT